MTADPWHCEACGAAYDMASRTLEVGLVRLALRGTDGFKLGSEGIEAERRGAARAVRLRRPDRAGRRR